AEESLFEWIFDATNHGGVLATGAEDHAVLFADLLHRGEVERLVPDHRSADGGAELMARIVRLPGVEGAFGPQRFVAEEGEGVSVNVVRSGLGDHRQRAAGRAADLAVEAILDHAKF